jgi:hypothetical protein
MNTLVRKKGVEIVLIKRRHLTFYRAFIRYFAAVPSWSHLDPEYILRDRGRLQYSEECYSRGCESSSDA